MLGVFGDGSDSDDERPQKQKRDSKAPLAARPMSFVSSGKQVREKEPERPAPAAPP